jgi:hypothetical protein
MKGPFGLVDIDSVLGKIRGDMNGLLPKVASRAVGEAAAEIVERTVGAVLGGGVLSGFRARP